MTAAQTYTVDVVFHGKDQGAQAMANTIGGSLSVLQGHLDRAAAGMERLGMIGVAAVGGVAAMGVRALTRDMVQLNSVTQDTEIGIAGMLQANGGALTVSSLATTVTALGVWPVRDACMASAISASCFDTAAGDALMGLAPRELGKSPRSR
jgi:hypothetical protein